MKKTTKALLLMASLMPLVSSVYADCCRPATCQPVKCCQLDCFSPCEFLKGWTYNMSLGYESEYVFRGARWAEHNVWGEVGIQMPGVFGGVAGIGVWALSPTNNPDEFCASEEVDLMAYYSRNIWCFVNAEIGAIYYTYPNEKSAGALGCEWEIYGTLSAEVFLNPYVTYNYNFDREQCVIEFGISEGTDLFSFCDTCVGIEGSAFIGWLHADEHDGKCGGCNSYTYATIQGDLVWNIKEGVSVYAGPRFSWNNDGENGPANWATCDEHQLWWGAYMSLSI